MSNINTRAIIAGFVFFVGFLLLVGAVGQAEYSCIEAGEFALRTILGGIMLIASMVVGGLDDIKEYIDDKKNR